MVVLFLCFSSHVLYQGYTIWKLITPDGRTTHTGVPISKVLLGEQLPGQLPGQIVHDMKEKQSFIWVSHRNLGGGGSSCYSSKHCFSWLMHPSHLRSLHHPRCLLCMDDPSKALASQLLLSSLTFITAFLLVTFNDNPRACHPLEFLFLGSHKLQQPLWPTASFSCNAVTSVFFNTLKNSYRFSVMVYLTVLPSLFICISQPKLP